MTDIPDIVSSFGSPDKPLRRYIALRKAFVRVLDGDKSAGLGRGSVPLKLIRTWAAFIMNALHLRSVCIRYEWRGQSTLLSFGASDAQLSACVTALAENANSPKFREEEDLLIIRATLRSTAAVLAVVLRHHKKWAGDDIKQSADDIGWAADSFALLEDVVATARRRELDRIAQRITHRQTMLKELRPNSLYYNLLYELDQVVGHDHSAVLLICNSKHAIVTAETIRYTHFKSKRIGQRLDLPLGAWAAIEGLKSNAIVTKRSESSAHELLCGAVYGKEWESKISSALVVPLDHSRDSERLVLVLADSRSGFFSPTDGQAVEYVAQRTARLIANSLNFALRLEQMSGTLDEAILQSRSQNELLKNACCWFKNTFEASAAQIALPPPAASNGSGAAADRDDQIVEALRSYLDRLRQSDRALYSRVSGHPAFAAVFGVPLRLLDGTIGTLVCLYGKLRQPSLFEQILLETAAQRIAAALTIRAVGDRQLSELHRVVQLMEVVADADDDVQLLEQLTKEVKALLNANYCFVSVPDHSGILHQKVKTWNEPFNVPPIRVTGQPRDGITGHVAWTRHIYRTGDVSKDQYYRDVVATGTLPIRIRSEMAGPLVFENRLLGVIDLMSSRESAFSDQHEALLHMLLTYSSIALAHEQRARARQSRLRLTQELHSKLLKLTTPDAIYAGLLDVAIDHISQLHLGHRIYGNLYVTHPKARFMEAKAFVGPKSERFSPVQYFNEGVVGTVAIRGTAMIIADTSAPPPGISYEPFIQDITQGSEIAVPVGSKVDVATGTVSKVDAVINLESAVPRLFDNRDLEALQALADEISLAVRFAQLHESVRMDQQRQAAQKEVRFLQNLSHEAAKSAESTSAELLKIEAILSSHSDARRMIQELRTQVDGSIALKQRLLDNFAGLRSTYESADVIEGLSNALNALSATDGIEICKEVATASFEVAGSSDSVEIIFRNLITNAVSAMKGSGQLRITEHEVNTPNTLVIDISDTGHGIPEARQSRIWDAYFSDDGTGKRKGLGIGLWIVREHMERIGGDLRLHISAVGKGTTFRLTFSARS